MHTVDNFAIEVVGQNLVKSSDLFFLEDWKVGREALSCHLSMDIFCAKK